MSRSHHLTISVATPSDCAELTELLRDSYRFSPDFIVRDDKYFQDHFNGRCAVLTARSAGQLISTMRANLISCSADLGYEDQGRLTADLIPALYLSRAATIRSSRARGVNSIMRLFCLEAAIELGLTSLVGYVYQDASRTRLMVDLGYRFSPIVNDSSPVFSDKKQGLFASLPLSQSGAAALNMLRSQFSDQQCTVLWEGDSISTEILKSSILEPACSWGRGRDDKD